MNNERENESEWKQTKKKKSRYFSELNVCDMPLSCKVNAHLTVK